MAEESELLEVKDPYALTREYIKEPPEGFWASFKYLGPGLVVTASIVGSGELIATTTLGARAGYVALWLILLSCFIKVAIQLEMGRYAISTGKTTLRAFNEIPGPRLVASWIIWAWIIMMVTKFVQFGGIAGGVAQALHIAVPAITVEWWTVITSVSVILLLIRGHYRLIQSVCSLMVAGFAFFTLFAAISLQWTPFAFSPNQILSGLTLSLPAGAAAVAFAAFGITGIGGDELIAYPYWCVEKGYARYVGPNEPTEAWVKRARGWVRVMYIDALVSMVIYTVATVAFYILGAAVLYGRGEVPKGYGMIQTLSTMYTESLGAWAAWIFLVGAFITLYSTLFSWTAATARIATDCLGTLKLVNFQDPKSRNRSITAFAVLWPLSFIVSFLLLRAPVWMVIVGGIGTGAMLVVIAYATIYLRYKRTDPRILPSKAFDALLWLSGLIIAAVGTYSIVQQLSRWL